MTEGSNIGERDRLERGRTKKEQWERKRIRRVEKGWKG